MAKNLGKRPYSPAGDGDKSGPIAGAGKKPGDDFRKSAKAGKISSPVEFGSKGMPSGVKVTHNRPAVLD